MRWITMRWVYLLFVGVLVACQSVPKKPYRPPAPPSVEDIAVWFTRAALAGDESRAHSLSLYFGEVPAIEATDNEAWEAEVKAKITALAALGDGEDGHVVTASVVERKTEKLVDYAIVDVAVKGQDSPNRLLFVYASGGWKFSPRAPGPVTVEDTAAN